MPTKIASGDARIDGLLSFADNLTNPVVSWQADNQLGTAVSITYGYATVAQNSVPGFQAMGSAWVEGVNNALEHISNVANISFTQGSANGSDMTLATANFAGTSTAGITITGWSFPSNESYGYYTDANVYMDSSSFSSAPIGSFAYEVLLHEIAHGIGLDHPFESPTVPAGTDSTKYTVMSYDNYYGFGTYATTLQLYDMLALQYLYGANTSYNSGNTTYDIEDFVSKGPATLWDGGGTDTLNLAGFSSGQTLNLTDGSFSSFGVTDNFAIAFGANIENAIGTSFNDTLNGNTLGNSLDGGAGNDTLYGSSGEDTFDAGSGNDLIYGGDDNDRVVFSNAIAGYEIAFNSTTDSFEIEDTNFSGDGDDKVFQVEIFQFSDQTLTAEELNLFIADPADITITGDTGNDVLDGNSFDNTISGLGGDDILRGESGNDTLYGGAGNDTLYGGNGPDILDGGDDDDLVVYDGQLEDYTILYDDFSGEISINHNTPNGDGNDTLTNIENVKFADQTLTEAELIDVATMGENLTGTDDDDVLNGSSLDDVITSGAGDDVIRGNAGDDKIFDAFGDDTIITGAGNDLAVAFTGNNRISGDSQVDVLLGGLGNDTIIAGAGDDVLVGDVGSDFYYGSDRLVAGAGTDWIEGGGGADVFVFSSNQGTNTIAELRLGVAVTDIPSPIGTDFQSGIDKIELSNTGFDDTAEAFDAVSNVSGTAQYDHNGTTIVFYGLRKSDLSADDFVLS